MFDNANSVERIICPSKNAYSKINEIQLLIERHAENKLVLLILGITAKVLAYRLSNKADTANKAIKLIKQSS